MPSIQDSIVIFVIALILFGPKRLPELARQLGKLMGEFRRASNDFRMQMEDELRISEQEDHQKKIDALAAAKPAPGAVEEPDATHPHLPAPIAESGEIKMMPPSTGLPQPATNWNFTPEPAADDLPGEVALGEMGRTSEEPVAELAQPKLTQPETQPVSGMTSNG